MITLPLLNVQLNPLDALLASLGARFKQLANSDNQAFLDAIADKHITLQFSSDDGVARFYRFDNAEISQHLGKADNADLTVHFSDSAAGAKLLARGDSIALMSAIQDKQVQITGDYKLVLWFVSIAKMATKIPEAYQGYIDTAKPYWQKSKPYAHKAGELLRKVNDKIKNL